MDNKNSKAMEALRSQLKKIINADRELNQKDLERITELINQYGLINCIEELKNNS